MKKIISISVTLLLISAISYYSFAQKSSVPVLKFILENKKVPKSDIKDIEKLVFTVENLTAELKIQWQNSVLEHATVKKLSFTDYDSNGIQKGELLLNIPNSLSNVRNILEGFGLNEFYLENVRILTKTLLNNEEAQQKAMSFVIKDFVFTKECNDSTLIEYYDFQIYYLDSKIQFMCSNGYAKYLFDGTVTSYTEKLDKMIIRRENFLQNKK